MPRGALFLLAFLLLHASVLAIQPGESVPKPDLILGYVDKLQSEDVLCWAASARRAMPHAAVMLVGTLPEEAVRGIEALDVRYVQRPHPQGVHAVVQRFRVYVEVLGQHAGEYGLVATTDVRDTVFQGDIFAGPLPDEMRATNTVMVQQVNVPAELTATKTAVPTLVSKEGTGSVNYKWLATFYTKGVADSLIGKPVVNGGGIFGQSTVVQQKEGRPIHIVVGIGPV